MFYSEVPLIIASSTVETREAFDILFIWIIEEFLVSIVWLSICRQKRKSAHLQLKYPAPKSTVREKLTHVITLSTSEIFNYQLIHLFMTINNVDLFEIWTIQYYNHPLVTNSLSGFVGNAIGNYSNIDFSSAWMSRWRQMLAPWKFCRKTRKETCWFQKI